MAEKEASLALRKSERYFPQSKLVELKKEVNDKKKDKGEEKDDESKKMEYMDKINSKEVVKSPVKVPRSGSKETSHERKKKNKSRELEEKSLFVPRKEVTEEPSSDYMPSESEEDMDKKKSEGVKKKNEKHEPTVKRSRFAISKDSHGSKEKIKKKKVGGSKEVELKEDVTPASEEKTSLKTARLLPTSKDKSKSKVKKYEYKSRVMKTPSREVIHPGSTVKTGRSRQDKPDSLKLVSRSVPRKSHEMSVEDTQQSDERRKNPFPSQDDDPYENINNYVIPSKPQDKKEPPKDPKKKKKGIVLVRDTKKKKNKSGDKRNSIYGAKDPRKTEKKRTEGSLMFERNRLQVLVDMINSLRNQGVERILLRRRTRLRWWKYYTWVLILWRIICYIMIAYAAFTFRYGILGYVHDIMGNKEPAGMINLVYEFFFAFFFVLFICILSEVLLFLAVQVQWATVLAYTYVFNFVMVIMLIGFAAVAAGYNPSWFTADIIGYALKDGFPEKLGAIHTEFECCGLWSPHDWNSELFFTWRDPLTYHMVNVTNTRRWKQSCQDCKLPDFCCQEDQCMEQADNAPLHDRGVHYSNTCIPALARSIHYLLLILGIAVALLIATTLPITLNICVVMIYHAGLGHCNIVTNRVRSPTKNALVWFFLRLDKKEKDDASLTDFSIIEEIQAFEVDDEVAA